jgi:hypothetical protein
MSWDAVIFLAIAFGYLAYLTIDAALSPEQREGYVTGWRDRELTVDLQGIGFTLLVVLVLWLLGTNARKRIISAIQASI